MPDPMDRREFFRSSLLRSLAGLIAAEELSGPGVVFRGARFVRAAEGRSPRSGSFCTIDPALVVCRDGYHDYTLTYTAGSLGLPLTWALAVRCLTEIGPEQNLKVSSSYTGFDPKVQVLDNIGLERVIWIQSGGEALPPGETITITLDHYLLPPLATECAFSVLEVSPDGPEPEIGSGLTFMEVPCQGGAVKANVAERLLVVVPARAQVGEPIRIRIAALDSDSQADKEYTGTVQLSCDKSFADLPSSVCFTPSDEGTLTFESTPLQPGILRLQVTDGFLSAESNPCVCTVEPVEEYVFFGDYHKHTFHSDGHLAPAENYAYARDYAFLDWCSLSPHDMPPFPTRGARNWSTVVQAAETFHDPGRFVTFAAYEWSHNNPMSSEDARGHKVVIFLHPEDLLPLIPYCYEEPGHGTQIMPPTTLLHELEVRAGGDVIVIPHHLPIYKWWIFPRVFAGEMGGPLPEPSRKEIDALEPVAEVFSKCLGMNECYEWKDWIKPPTTWGWDLLHTFWQDALKEGVRAGAVCGGDNHNRLLGQPEMTALTGVMAPVLDRESIFRAIQKRRTYGTSGPRLFLRFNIGAARMGEEATFDTAGPAPLLEAEVVSPVPIEAVDVVRVTPGAAETVHVFQTGGALEATLSWRDLGHDPGRWACYYLRVHLDGDAHGAWTSPIWLDPPVDHCPEDPSGSA